MGKKIGITDIARLSDTSITAVSRVLGNKPNRYSEATVKRIREVAEKHGYMPNPYARSMRTGRYDTIGLIMGRKISQSFSPMELQWGIDDAIQKRDLMLGVHYIDTDRLDDDAYLQQCLRSWRCDGVLLNLLPKVPRKLTQFLNKTNMPWVALNVRATKDSVYIKEKESGRIAAEHLLAHGHKKIAYLQGEGAVNSVHHATAERIEGCQAALANAGVKLRMVEIPMHHAPVGMEAMMKLMQGRNRPTAIISAGKLFSDWAGVAAYRSGLRVPEDLSLVCISENPSNALGLVPDVVQLPFEPMGFEAVGLLAQRIEKKGASISSVALDPVLVKHGMAVGQPAG